MLASKALARRVRSWPKSSVGSPRPFVQDPTGILVSATDGAGVAAQVRVHQAFMWDRAAAAVARLHAEAITYGIQMLRTLLVFGILIPGIIAAFSWFAALLLYLWYALFRPQEFTWIDFSALHVSFVLGILLVIPSLLSGILPNLSHPLSVSAILFLADCPVCTVQCRSCSHRLVLG